MSHVRELQGNRSMLALKNKNSPPCLNRETNEAFASLVIWMLAKKPCLSVLWLQTLPYNFHSEEYVPKKRKAKYVYYFFICSAGSQWFGIQTHHIVMLQNAIPWSVKGLERWKCLCGTTTLCVFIYQFVLCLSKSNQSSKIPTSVMCALTFLQIKYKQ